MPLLASITAYALDYMCMPTFWLALIPAVLTTVYIVPYLLDPLGLRTFPGPIFAKFTSGWLPWVISQNRWSAIVDSLHRKDGIFVRLSPNHISIAHPVALPAVYGHSSGALKAPFYDAFASFKTRNMFNTLSRTEHTRKRRIESQIFSQQSVRELEGTARVHHIDLVSQWDKLYSYVKRAESGAAREGFNYWSFDTIGDLAFGDPFGMILAAKDTARSAKSVKASLETFSTSSNTEKLAFETEELPVTKIMGQRGELVAMLGWLPEYVRPIILMMPGFRSNLQAIPKVAGLAVAAVAKRMNNPDARADMLNRLLDAPGAITVANTSCATTYYLARDQRVQAKLQTELDDALKAVDSVVAPHGAIKHLPYLDAVVNEGLRLHSPVGAGLPRVVPEGGMTVLGHTFKEGTWVSVPTYHLHRDENIWGENASEFYPERWIEASGDQKKAMLDAFVPFSIGPRACIGRNLALMQLHIVLATLFHRFNVVLESDDPVRSQAYALYVAGHAAMGIEAVMLRQKEF
ncbi:cytochrome P450 monooxygenase pc-bph [Wolfiporia cocos MD-104 SS10]|uniref:Cytochrome P450 monooxygenase pc-bph n=1 Tax=Wolfiporia cocos (strain MD-104) TaxID=742152 RepID=A0A2H3K5A7_WOLCO|nr:cytochrome P450 monooxygenase pc-bph [Wolfiporia cocos MD-104 SS10]